MTADARCLMFTHAALLAVLVFASSPVAQKCVIKEEKRAIKTYGFSDPNPVPVLVKRPAIYPYFSFDGYERVGSLRTWKVVRLENAHIKAYILPEVGGKVYGALEKSTGKEFIYLNEVLKFRQVALRGPWTSGGIEFNFGVVGHAPSCAAPVDYRLRRNPDGGVSCIVGTLDLASRTRWSVTVTLPGDGAYLEIRPLWYNPTPFHQSYYVWMNTAVRAGKDLHYFYPGRFAMSHDNAPPQPWPVDPKGRDLSWYRNNAFGGSKSHFVFGKYENFFGGYWQDADFGFGHWALHDDMPGRKMWIWALSRQGAIWEDLLTDTDGQYSEPQSGRLLSQSHHEFFPPRTGDTWREIVFPVKGIGGLVAASPHGALNVERRGNLAQVGLCPLQALEDDLVVHLDGKRVHRERLVLKPMEVHRSKIRLPSTKGRLEVRVAGKLRYSDEAGKNEIHRPYGFGAVKESTAEGLYLAGVALEKQRRLASALQKYHRCLEREPIHLRALTRTAEAYGRRAEYEKGLVYASRALKIAPYDPDACHAYGVLSRLAGGLVDAKETLGWAARSLKYRACAYGQMAEILVLEGDVDLAGEYAARALDANRHDLRAREVQAVIHRLRGNAEEARASLTRLLDLDPLNHVARFERCRLDPSPETREAFRAGFQSELPHEHFLETALLYTALGLADEAVAVLKQSPPHTVVHYWLAYLLRKKSPEESKAFLERAASRSPRLVFPFRAETIPVLAWAERTRPEDWKPGYYLGLILWGKGRVDEARKRFLACGKAAFAPLHLILGHLEKHRALSHFRTALAVDEKDWRTWHHLVRRLNETGHLEEALARAEKAADRFPGNTVLALDRARILLHAGRSAACLTLLDGLEVLPYEGGWEAHHLFRCAHVHAAMDLMRTGDTREALRHLEASRTYPEHLGTGRPFDPDFRLQDALSAVCHASAGEAASAGTSWKKVLDSTRRHPGLRNGSTIFCLFALREAGETDRTEELLKDLERRFPENPIAQWCRARFKGDRPKAEAIEKDRQANARFRLVAAVARFLAAR